MYTASILLGIAAAVIWVAQGEFLHLQSPNDQTMMRNTGIFWCIFQLRKFFITDRFVEWKTLILQLIENNNVFYENKKSLIIGNLYIYLEWSGKNDVTRPEINRLFLGVSILCMDYRYRRVKPVKEKS